MVVEHHPRMDVTTDGCQAPPGAAFDDARLVLALEVSLRMSPSTPDTGGVLTGCQRAPSLEDCGDTMASSRAQGTGFDDWKQPSTPQQPAITTECRQAWRWRCFLAARRQAWAGDGFSSSGSSSAAAQCV